MNILFWKFFLEHFCFNMLSRKFCEEHFMTNISFSTCWVFLCWKCGTKNCVLIIVSSTLPPLNEALLAVASCCSFKLLNTKNLVNFKWQVSHIIFFGIIFFLIKKSVGGGNKFLFISLIFKGSIFWKIISLQANIRNTFFDQKSPRHPEVGVLGWRRQTNKHTDGHGNSPTDPA